MRKLAANVLGIAVLFSLSLQAQTTTVKVWPSGAPGAKASTSYQEETAMVQGKPRVRRVTDPVLMVYLPDRDRATGAAVVICPGGGYGVLAIDHEGYDIAAWLNSFGVAGIVLKYRLPSDNIMEDKSIGPLQDAQEAIRIVRRRADQWGLDRSRIGIIGFSAGGHLASTASTHFSDRVYVPADSISARPDFSILLYPVISFEDGTTHRGSRTNLIGDNADPALVRRFSNEKQVGSDTPPAFIVHSADDKGVPVENSLLYFQALVRNGVAGELHVYEKGGHGYGLAQGRSTESSWPEACRKWLDARGFLRRR